MNLLFVFALIFLITFVSGRYIERIRVPWIFSSLLLGVVATAVGWHIPPSDTETFTVFAKIGMYLLLFLVGFEMNTHMLRKNKKFILSATIAIVACEGLFGSLAVHYLFGYDWIVSVLIALSFATVGEAVLVPILDERGILNTRLGQSIIGIGTMDDVVEVILLVVASFVVGSIMPGHTLVVFGALALLSILAYGLIKIHPERELFRLTKIETIFIFVLFIFFLFVGIGGVADAAPLGAILAGLVVRVFLPATRRQAIESEIRTITYGFFAPLFFFWVGSSLNLGYLWHAPLLILAIVLVSSIAKLVATLAMSKNKLGTKPAVLLGVGLLVRFSTGIIVMQFLLDHGVIGSEVYSVIVASTVIFTIAVPIIFSVLFARWKNNLDMTRV